MDKLDEETYSQVYCPINNNVPVDIVDEGAVEDKCKDSNADQRQETAGAKKNNEGLFFSRKSSVGKKARRDDYEGEICDDVD